MKKIMIGAVIAALVLANGRLFAADANIRLNSLGFLLSQDKRASINSQCTRFSVINVSGGTSVFEGAVSGPQRDPDTEEDIYIADFSPVTAEGMYYLRVDGVGRSFNFPIDNHVYDSAYYTAMRGMYLMRCGTVVSATYKGNRFRHAACHTSDAYLDYFSNTHSIKNSRKGWHDAGDYNKYTVNAGITVGMLFNAWALFKPLIETVPLDIPETGGPLPDFLAEIKWELDWLLTMQFEDGRVSHKVSATGFCGFIMPDAEIAPRYFVPWGSAATADFVAMMATAARIYRPYDAAFADTCLAAAQRSYDYLASHPEDMAPDQSGFSTGQYRTGDKDDRLWAAAELWETTGEKTYLDDFEARAAAERTKIDFDFDWSNVKNLGMFTYVLSRREGKRTTLSDSITQRLVLAADTIVGRRNSHAYGRTLMRAHYWGCNGSIARQTMVLQIANRIAPKSDYLNAGLDAIGYLFGRNYYCRSFVTGMGINPPLFPHDRRSGADDVQDPWPGYLVGGGHPTEKSWVDEEESYQTNEIAINWQGALVFALAGYIKGGSSAVANPEPARRIPAYVGSATGVLAGIGSNLLCEKGEYALYDCSGRLLQRIGLSRPGMVRLTGKSLGAGVVIVKRIR
ncbi:MAG: glycoside hydrolase family 9 protein [Chitinispirillaceae bacterium]|nr:glycoside hydrolase family 9 protein [Chitinispirillaceae bacterium]